MKLSLTDLERLAELSSLSLARDNKIVILDQLNSFFQYVERIRAIDTTQVETLTHPASVFQDVCLQLQEDVPMTSLNFTSVLSNAPQTEQNYFVIPKVVD